MVEFWTETFAYWGWGVYNGVKNVGGEGSVQEDIDGAGRVVCGAMFHHGGASDFVGVRIGDGDIAVHDIIDAHVGLFGVHGAGLDGGHACDFGALEKGGDPIFRVIHGIPRQYQANRIR